MYVWDSLILQTGWPSPLPLGEGKATVTGNREQEKGNREYIKKQENLDLPHSYKNSFRWRIYHSEDVGVNIFTGNQPR